MTGSKPKLISQESNSAAGTGMRSAAQRAARSRWLACLVVALVTVATWWPRIGGPIDLRWDGGAYFILGTSLAHGDGYRMLSEPGSLPSSLHPPLVPALVAVHEIVMGTADPIVVGHALRVTIAAASVACAIAIFLLLDAFVPRAYALVAAALAALPPQYVYFSDALYAEVVFTLFTVLFFILQRHRENTACFLLSGLCAVLAYEARTAGIVLLAAWVADNVLRRDFRRALIALAISLAPVLAWMGWVKAVESSRAYQRPAYAYQTAPYLYFNVSYARNLTLKDPWAPELGPATTADFVRRVWSGVQIVPETVGHAVSSWNAPRRVTLPLAALVLGGLMLQLKRRQFLVPLYVVLSLAAMCSTPYQQQYVRYAIPLYPFLVLALLQVLALAATALRARWPTLPRVASHGLAVLVLGVVVHQMLASLADLYRHHHDDVAYRQQGQPVAYELFYYAPAGPAFDEALDWLQPRLQPADVVVATDPQWVYLRTGRKAVLPPFEPDGRKAQQLVDTVPAKFVLLPTTGYYHRYLSAMLRDNPAQWTRVWRSADGGMEVHERTRVVPQAPTQ